MAYTYQFFEGNRKVVEAVILSAIANRNLELAALRQGMIERAQKRAAKVNKKDKKVNINITQLLAKLTPEQLKELGL